MKTPIPPARKSAEWFQVHRNACRCTGYKQLVDAVMDAAKVMRGEMTMEELLFKLPADGRIWGSKYPRPIGHGQGNRHAATTAPTSGLKMPPETLQLALVQAEVSHANIHAIDTYEAEKMPGVVKVVTHKDVKGKNRITGLITFPTNKGDGWDRPILCDEKIFQYRRRHRHRLRRHRGPCPGRGRQGQGRMEQLPAYMSAPAAMAEDAIEIHPGTPNIYFDQKIIKGEDTAPPFRQGRAM